MSRLVEEHPEANPRSFVDDTSMSSSCRSYRLMFRCLRDAMVDSGSSVSKLSIVTSSICLQLI